MFKQRRITVATICKPSQVKHNADKVRVQKKNHHQATVCCLEHSKRANNWRHWDKWALGLFFTIGCFRFLFLLSFAVKNTCFCDNNWREIGGGSIGWDTYHHEEKMVVANMGRCLWFLLPCPSRSNAIVAAMEAAAQGLVLASMTT